MSNLLKLLKIISFLCITTFLFPQHYNVDLETTGESQLTIFSDSITSLDPGDEIGIFDLNAITNYNDCSDQIGELLVGAGIWDGSQLDLVSIGSVDLCAFGGPQLAGFVEGNDVIVRVWKMDEQVEYETVLTWSAGTGAFGDVIQQVSEIALGSVCADDNDTTAAFGGCAGAVAALGCEFVFAGSPMSEICPETCGECEAVLGCTDDIACNYNVFANEDDDSCIYAEDLAPWCDDIDGDGFGFGESVYSCSQPFNDQFIFSWVQDCSDLEPDCATNDTDQCGICGGNGPVENYDCDGNCIVEIDCLGQCGGNAEVDDCGICNGGNLSQDCTGQCGGNAEVDVCGNCNGNCFWIIDDLVAECGDSEFNLITVDCLGQCGGDAEVDECGICDGSGLNENGCCGDSTSDCLGECDGSATLDECGICDSDPSNDCLQDCLGEWGGDAILDECGECNGPGAIYECGCYDIGDDGFCVAYEDVQEIFNTNCTTYCHSGGAGSGGLDLTSYDNLMLGNSDHGPVVIPFDSENSILIQKLLDNPPFGQQMPRDGIPLDQEIIDIIALWIDEGANPPQETTCADNEFECYDGTCIDSYFECDGYYDCPDYSDEYDCFDGGDSGGATGGTTGGDDGGLEPFGELHFGNIDFENRTVEILMDCIYQVSAFDIDVSGIVVNSAYGGDAESLDFDVSTTESNVSGTSTGEYIPENNGLLTILEYDQENGEELCFEYSSITTYVGIEYEAILGDCVSFPNGGEGDEFFDISLPLHNGSNLVSFYGLPADVSIENIMNSLESVTGVIGEGVAASYTNGIWLGSLEEIDPASGYWVKLSDNDTLTLFNVTSIDPSMTYSLHEGMNLISFPSEDSLGIQEAIPDVFENFIFSIIGEGTAGYNLNGNWVGSLTDFYGGKGYWFGATEDIDFNFENIDLSRSFYSISKNAFFDKKYYQSSAQAFYFFKDIEGVELGDIIEVYEENTLVGRRKWKGAYTDIPAMGKDQSEYTKEYCEKGSLPTFKLIKSNAKEEYWLTGYIAPWENNELFILEALSKAVEIPDRVSISNIYPNPFNPSTIISFDILEGSNVLLEVYDINGIKISSLFSDYCESGHYSVEWNAAEYSSGIYFVKLITNEYVDVKKMMLIK